LQAHVERVRRADRGKRVCDFREVKRREDHVDEEGVLASLLRLLRGQLVEFEYEILVRLLVHVRRVDENLIVEEGKVLDELELGNLKIHRWVIRRGVRP
jgi:hypothetical protein